MLANLVDFHPEQHAVKETELHGVDRYMLDRLQQLITKVRKSYDEYDFATVFHEIHNYLAIDLSAFYLDFAKDVLYIEAENDKRRRSIQTVCYETLIAITKMLSPIIPHTTEEIWEHINDVEAEYVQLTDMPYAREVENFDEAERKKWDHFMEVRSDVLKALEEARDDKVIGNSLEAKVYISAKDDETKTLLEEIPNVHQLF